MLSLCDSIALHVAISFIVFQCLTINLKHFRLSRNFGMTMIRNISMAQNIYACTTSLGPFYTTKNRTTDLKLTVPGL